MSKRNERLYLSEMVAACEAVTHFVAGLDQSHFLAHEMARDAVARRLTILGEAASNISQQTRDRFPDVPWKKVIALRNIVVHAYFAVDWVLVWEIATRNVPELKPQLTAILLQLP